MRYLSKLDLFATVCRAEQAWGLYVSSTDWLEELVDGQVPTYPHLRLREHPQAFVDGCAVFLYRTESAMLAAFRQVRGDEAVDGDGPRTYALTCSPEGRLLSENK